MYIEEHDLTGPNTMTPLVARLLETVGTTCREMRPTEDHPQSMFVFPHAINQVVIDHDSEWLTLMGAYTIIDDADDEKHWLILVAADRDLKTVLFTPVDTFDQDEDSIVLGDLKVMFVAPWMIGSVTLFGPLP